MRPRAVSALTLRACRCRSRTVSEEGVEESRERAARLGLDPHRRSRRTRGRVIRFARTSRQSPRRAAVPVSPRPGPGRTGRRREGAVVGDRAQCRPQAVSCAKGRGDRRQDVRQLPVEGLGPATGRRCDRPTNGDREAGEHRAAGRARAARRGSCRRRRRRRRGRLRGRGRGRARSLSPERSNVRVRRCEPGQIVHRSLGPAEQRLQSGPTRGGARRRGSRRRNAARAGG